MTDESENEPKNLRDLLALAADETASEFRRIIARKATNQRARVARRRKEIERLMYLGLSDYDILAEFLLQPDLEILLSGFVGERGAQTFQDEIANIRKAREKDGERVTGMKDLIRVYREIGRKTIDSIPTAGGAEKRYWQDAQIALHQKIAEMSGFVEQPQGHRMRPVRQPPAPLPSPPPAEGGDGDQQWGTNPKDVLKGYEVDESESIADD